MIANGRFAVVREAPLMASSVSDDRAVNLAIGTDLTWTSVLRSA